MNEKIKNGDLFVDRELNPEELKRFGVDTKLTVKCLFLAHHITLRDAVKTIRVREEVDCKTYSIWFKDGGTIELVINDKDELELVDSYGCDFSFAFNSVDILSHKHDPNSPRYAGADRNYDGPANSGEMFASVFGHAEFDDPETDDETRH